jgi:hypothetical protein
MNRRSARLADRPLSGGHSLSGTKAESRSSGYGSLRELGLRQLQIQFALLSMYDTQATGILAPNGALAAAAIAARDLIGHLWGLSLIGLLLSSGACVFALGYPQWQRIHDEKIGPKLKPLIVPAANLSADQMDKAIAIALGDAIADNRKRLHAKQGQVRAAVGLLAMTILVVVLCVLFLSGE